MKLILTIFLFVALDGCVQLANGQSRVEAHLVENDTIAKYLVKTFRRITHKKVTDLCISSTVFAQFKIGADGSIINVEYREYDKRYPVFKEILSELIAATKGLWIPAKEGTVTVESKLFILPLIFEMETGCPIGSHPPYNESNQAFTNLFTEGKVRSQIDCVLLAPYHMMSSAN